MTELDLVGIDLKKTKLYGRLVESVGNWTMDYAVLVLPISITFVLLGTVTHESWTTTANRGVILLSLFVLSALFTVYTAIRIQLNRRFLPIPTNLSKKDSRQRITDLIREEGWLPLRNNQDYIVATVADKHVPNQEVIILFREAEVLVNIRLASGMRGRFPFSFGRNKRLIQRIEQRIKTPSNIKQADQHAAKAHS